MAIDRNGNSHQPAGTPQDGRFAPKEGARSDDDLDGRKAAKTAYTPPEKPKKTHGWKGTLLSGACLTGVMAAGGGFIYGAAQLGQVAADWISTTPYPGPITGIFDVALIFGTCTLISHIRRK